MLRALRSSVNQAAATNKDCFGDCWSRSLSPLDYAATEVADRSPESATSVAA